MINPEAFDYNDLPWDVKVVKIELGGHEGRWIDFEVFGDKLFRISFANVEMFTGDGNISTGEMHMEVARRLRDFLNYAVPNVPLA